MVVSIEDIPQTKIIPAGRKASGGSGSRVEAAIGIEPMYRGFADLCLTAWLRRRPENPECGTVRTWSGPAPGGSRPTDWSGKRESNPRLQPWQGCTLPLSYSRSRPGTPGVRRSYRAIPWTVKASAGGASAGLEGVADEAHPHHASRGFEDFHDVEPAGSFRTAADGQVQGG